MATSKGQPGALLTSIQVPALRAGQTDWYSLSGQAHTSSDSLDSIIMTSPGPNTTQPATNIAWHGTGLVVHPGVLNANNPNAAWPDLQMWLQIDTNLDTKSFCMFDLSHDRLIWAPRELTRGGHYLPLGKSLYQAAALLYQMRSKNPQVPVTRAFGPGNWPLLFTGPKVADDITFHFSSTAGFTTGQGPTDTFSSPPTVELYGDAFDATMWAYVMAAMGAWRGDILITSLRRQLTKLPPYRAMHQVVNLSDFAGDGFRMLPDGVKQTGGKKVYRYNTWAQNAKAFSGTDVYPLTNQIQGLGQAGQVVDNNHDLGFKLLNTQNAYQVDFFGRLPVAGSGYWMITSQGSDKSETRYPFDTDYGQLDTLGNPHYWYGYSYPWNEKDEYVLPRRPGDAAPGAGGSEVFAGENAAYGTAALNGQTVAALAEYHHLTGQFITS